MRRLLSFLALCLAVMGGSGSVRAQFDERFEIRGYVQGAPLYVSSVLPEFSDSDSWLEYRLQNRLNLRWRAGSSFIFHWQMRTRLFAGDLVEEIPGYAAGIGADDGLVDLSWMIAERDRWLLHHIPDRLYGEWDRGHWNVRVGRQRVNWGVNMITNPNDIFNLYSFYDFDYPERPGSDAVRIQRFLGFGSRLELAASPGRNRENSVAAGLYAFNAGGYDVQLIGGYYRERLATGAGWAGNLKGAGFKGEVMYYADLEKKADERAANAVAAVSVDYMFPNRLFLVTEMLYNRDGGREDFRLVGGRFAPDNPSLSRYQLTAQAVYPVHPLADGTLAVIVYPDMQAFFISPSVKLSVSTNLDFQLLAQIFVGSSDSTFSDTRIVTGSLKYHF